MTHIHNWAGAPHHDDDTVRVGLFADYIEPTETTSEYASADDATWDTSIGFSSILMATLYNPDNPRAGELVWTKYHGWVFYPYRPPRPWKVHTPGRFRQRRRR